jgi:bifunctional non-homologous end joining protein LigD
LILGKYIDGKLTYGGHTGTGFNRELIQEILQKLEKITVTTSHSKISLKPICQ